MRKWRKIINKEAGLISLKKTAHESLDSESAWIISRHHFRKKQEQGQAVAVDGISRKKQARKAAEWGKGVTFTAVWRQTGAEEDINKKDSADDG